MKKLRLLFTAAILLVAATATARRRTRPHGLGARPGLRSPVRRESRSRRARRRREGREVHAHGRHGRGHARAGPEPRRDVLGPPRAGRVARGPALRARRGRAGRDHRLVPQARRRARDPRAKLERDGRTCACATTAASPCGPTGVRARPDRRRRGDAGPGAPRARGFARSGFGRPRAGRRRGQSSFASTLCSARSPRSPRRSPPGGPPPAT